MRRKNRCIYKLSFYRVLNESVFSEGASCGKPVPKAKKIAGKGKRGLRQGGKKRKLNFFGKAQRTPFCERQSAEEILLRKANAEDSPF